MLSFLLFSGIQASQAASDYSESDIKAAMLLKIIRYVQFPQDKTLNEEYLRICIAGEHAIYNSLIKNQTKLQRNKLHSFGIVKIDQGAAIENCDVLFLSRSLEQDFLTTLDQTLEQPVLTISDSFNAAEKGVMLNFIPKGNFIGFEINPEAAQIANISFSSELLKLGAIKQTQRIIQHADKDLEDRDSKKSDALENSSKLTNGGEKP